MMQSATKILFSLTLAAAVLAGVFYAQGNPLGALIAGIVAVWLAALGAGKLQPWTGLLVSNSRP